MPIYPFDNGRTIKALCYGCEDGSMLRSPEWIEGLAWALCNAIQMTGITAESVQFWKNDGTPSGVSAVLFIEESHIAIHTWPESASLRVVVDSCKEFDPRLIKNFLNEMLDPFAIFVRTLKKERASRITTAFFRLSLMMRFRAGRLTSQRPKEAERG
ncbi:MAG: hypothetical protein GY847_01400 [Proteobacteria bacterium]|nr:hypothetical protein [Pseudomonadota bacterium]